MYGYPIEWLCDLLNINRSSYYKWLKRKPSKRQLENEQLAEKITDMYNKHDGVFGTKMMKIHINREHKTNYNHKRIRRIMRVLGLSSVIRRQTHSCTKSNPKEQAAENILNREFHADNPNEKWVTDVTEFKYGTSFDDIHKLYLSVILDLCDRRPVAYVLGDSNNNQLVFDTFDMAVALNPGAKPIFHSDRGYQYTSRTFHRKLEQAGMTQSMSRVAHCTDNGPMEGFWGILKREMYYKKKFHSREELVSAIVEYIDYYVNSRPQRGLGVMTPMEYHDMLMAA